MPILLLLLQDSVGWRTDYEEGSKIARENKQLMLVHFWRPQQVEEAAFSRPDVIERSARFVCIRINALRDEALARYFGVVDPPATLILSPDGTTLARLDADRIAPLMAAYAEVYPRLPELKGKELFDAHWALENWDAAAGQLERIGPEADAEWYYTRRIDLALKRTGRGNLDALRAAAEAARRVPGLEDDVAAIDAIVKLSEKKFDAAIEIANKHRGTSNRDDVFLMVSASALLQQGKKADAKPILEELASKHPHSDFGRWAAALIP